MHHVLYVATMLFLVGVALAIPAYAGYAAVGNGVATGCWFYFSLRGTRRLRGEARGGIVIIAVVFAVAALLLANPITDEHTRVFGTVTNCISSTQRLTGHTGIACSAMLDTGGVEHFPSGTAMPPGTPVTFHRYSRRFLGYHYEYAGSK